MAHPVRTDLTTVGGSGVINTDPVPTDATTGELWVGCLHRKKSESESEKSEESEESHAGVRAATVIGVSSGAGISGI